MPATGRPASAASLGLRPAGNGRGGFDRPPLPPANHNTPGGGDRPPFNTETLP